MFRRDESPRRRGRDVDLLWIRVAADARGDDADIRRRRLRYALRAYEKLQWALHGAGLRALRRSRMLAVALIIGWLPEVLLTAGGPLVARNRVVLVAGAALAPAGGLVFAALALTSDAALDRVCGSRVADDAPASARAEPDVEAPPSMPAKDAKLWLTTANCAECRTLAQLFEASDAAGVSRSLGVWLPQGYDVYVVAVQECLCWAELLDAIAAYRAGVGKLRLGGERTLRCL